MMDKTRGRKAAPTPRASPLDLISALGGWLWRGGLFAQLLWHLTYVVKALEHQDDGMYDPDDKSVLATGLEGTKVVLAWLPAEDVLIRMSIIAAIFSAWWNPHFVQFTRGFTRHLLGFTRWYSFQGLIIFLRILFRSVVGMDGGAARSQSAQLSFHTATAGVMCFVSWLFSLPHQFIYILTKLDIHHGAQVDQSRYDAALPPRQQARDAPASHDPC